MPEYSLTHPGHYPFISAFTFRTICDHKIDHVREFDPELVKRGDIIYLNCWYLIWFASYVHPKIKEPYILVTCDTNTWLPYPCLKWLIFDKKCAAWFGRNMIFSGHPKMFQIPMGQDLIYFDQGVEKRDTLLKTAATPSMKKHHLYMNFYARPKHDRPRIVELFENAPYCFSRNKSDQDWTGISSEQFYQEMAASQFILSPWGVEFEAIRTWEAVVLGSIPIVEHSFLDPLYEDLPILLIHDWDEINEQFLEKNYEKLKSKSSDKAYFDYWANLIKETQFKVKNGNFHPIENILFTPEDIDNLFSLLDLDQNTLIYRGALTLERPLQVGISGNFLSEIVLYDRWCKEDLRLFFGKINRIIDNELDFEKFLKIAKPSPLFLDLTYHRSTLLRDDDVMTKDWELIRHSLKRDIYALFDQLKVGSRIIGNMLQDRYVQEVLDQISKEKKWKIYKKGNFWSIHKTLIELLSDFYPEQTIQPSYFSMPASFPFDSILGTISNAVEIGTQSSAISCRLGQSLSQKGKLFSVEPSLEYDKFLSNIAYAKLTDQIIPMRVPSHEAAKIVKTLHIPIDLIYIHETRLPQIVYDDLSHWITLLSEHSTICGDGEIQAGVIRFAQEHKLRISYNNNFWQLK